MQKECNSGSTAQYDKLMEQLREEQLRLHPEIYDNKNGGLK